MKAGIAGFFLALPLATACMRVQPSGGFNDVQGLVSTRTAARVASTHDAAAIETANERVRALLADQLTPDSAVSDRAVQQPSIASDVRAARGRAGGSRPSWSAAESRAARERAVRHLRPGSRCKKSLLSIIAGPAIPPSARTGGRARPEQPATSVREAPAHVSSPSSFERASRRQAFG
jgi:hypothetical protein